MQVKTSVKAGGISSNHNEAQVRAASLTVKTGVKAGDSSLSANHNEAQVRVR
ncbi:MAG: hypothetical protein JO112_05405 [Planctomycetes bacterium]|nr:hypothetical protein [Planctomycetota bacterium]